MIIESMICLTKLFAQSELSCRLGIFLGMCIKKDWLWIEAGVPGLTGKDVEVKVEDDVLTMSIPHRAEDTGSGITYFVRELGIDAVTRSMRLPAYVDVDKATATCKDGILSIGFPKRVEAMARQIPIEDKMEV